MDLKMMFEHKLTKQVEFSHTDMAGIMHFSNFYRFMEAVEHDLFRKLGKTVAGEIDERGFHLGWPRVNASCSFKAPLKFEDSIELHLIIREIRNATVRYEVIFNKNGAEAARGEITIVHVGVNPDDGVMKACPLPEWLTDQISEAPEDYMVSKKNK